MHILQFSFISGVRYALSHSHNLGILYVGTCEQTYIGLLWPPTHPRKRVNAWDDVPVNS